MKPRLKTAAQREAAKTAAALLKSHGEKVTTLELLQLMFYRGCEYGRMNPLPSGSNELRQALSLFATFLGRAMTKFKTGGEAMTYPTRKEIEAKATAYSERLDLPPNKQEKKLAYATGYFAGYFARMADEAKEKVKK